MINAIAQIGKLVAGDSLNRDDFLDKICLKLESEKNIKGKKVKQHIVILNFNTKTKKIELEVDRVNAEGNYSGKKYLWIGDTIRHKLYCSISTCRIDRILETTFPKLKKYKGIDKNIFEIILKYFSHKNKINPEKFNFFEQEKEIIQSKDSISNLIKCVFKSIKPKGYFKYYYENNKPKTRSNQISLYSVKVNGELLCKTNEYKDMIYREKIESLFEENNKNSKYLISENNCSICMCRKTTTSNTSNLGFKFYMTDKLGFSSNLDGKFVKNYNICKNCYQKLMIAEKFIDEKLSCKIGGLDVYILPNFIFYPENFKIEEFSQYIQLKTDLVKQIKISERKLNRYIKFKDQKNSFLINYLFYRKSNSEFKILKLIKDIPPTRLDLIRKKEEEIQLFVNEKFQGNDSLKIDLNKIWNLIPIKLTKESKHGYIKYLNIIESIFSGSSINYNLIISQLLEVIRIIKYEKKGTNIWIDKPDLKIKPDFTYKVIQMNFLIHFLKKLNILEGGIIMEEKEEKLNLDEMIPIDIIEYWKNIEVYNNRMKKGLFLLGSLIGKIGKAQSLKEIKNQPILNKINFHGMNNERLMRLSSEVLEKLRHFKILKYNKELHTVCHLMIEENIEDWTLSNQENVFYIISGYAFEYYLLRKESKEKYHNEFKEKNEFINQAQSNGHDIKKMKEKLEEAKTKAEHHQYSEARKILKEIKKEDKKNEQ